MTDFRFLVWVSLNYLNTLNVYRLVLWRGAWIGDCFEVMYIELHILDEKYCMSKFWWMDGFFKRVLMWVCVIGMFNSLELVLFKAGMSSVFVTSWRRIGFSNTLVCWPLGSAFYFDMCTSGPGLQRFLHSTRQFDLHLSRLPGKRGSASAAHLIRSLPHRPCPAYGERGDDASRSGMKLRLWRWKTFWALRTMWLHLAVCSACQYNHFIIGCLLCFQTGKNK